MPKTNKVKLTQGGMMLRILKITLLNFFSFQPWVGYFIKKLGPYITVLMYHGISADDEELHSWTLVKKSQFEKQIVFLKNHFKIISIDKLDINNLKDNEKPKLIVTFDDGYKNNLAYALPLLEKYNVPATIYICTEAVQNSKLFWWDKIILIILLQKIKKINLYKYGLKDYEFNHHKSAKAIWEDIQKLLEDLKKLQPIDRQIIIDKLTGSNFEKNNYTFSPFNVLTPMEVSKISKSELITIGSHSHCHNILTQIPYESVEESIKTSINLLEKWTGKHIEHLTQLSGLRQNRHPVAL
jgi:peptidoglycan/xylan/chitin deacetylase (PgdA/CDA1 family)